MHGVVNIDDLRKLAKKRLPKIAYDFIEGGTDDEVGLVTNEQAFRQARIVPRYLVDVTVRDQSTTLFGRTYSSPIGIAPTGLAGLFRRGADLMLAQAARDANVPFIMSGSSTASIEDLGKLAPDHGWYQLYSAKDQSISEDMIKRAGDAGLQDAGLHRRRAGRLEPRAQHAQRLGPAAQAHLVDQARGAASIRPGCWNGYATARPTSTTGPSTRRPKRRRLGRRFRRLPEPRADDLEACRALSRAVEGQLRAEGHHASRRCDPRPFAGRRRHHGLEPRRAGSSTTRRRRLQVLPAIRDAVGDKMTLMFDGGIRRGLDALIALCTGAKFVFVGRPTLYGVTAGGMPGAAKALQIFRREIDLSMAQIGATRIADLGPQFPMWRDARLLAPAKQAVMSQRTAALCGEGCR